MYHIIYLSSAVDLFSRGELEELLAQSRRNNERLGVTGILLYKDWNFMQVLEGEESVLKNLFEKISQDPRHRGILTLFREKIPVREFAGWSMAFKNLDADPHQVPDGFNDLLNKNWKNIDWTDYSPKVRAFLRCFSDWPQERTSP